MQNMSFKNKLCFTFIVYGLILGFVSQFITYNINKKNIESVLLEQAALKFQERDDYLKNYVKDATSKIAAIKTSQIFNNYIHKNSTTDVVNALFLDIANSSQNIMQIRFLNSNGMEQIRIQRDKHNTPAYVSKETDLQNKADRYYFKAISKISDNQFWYSNLDLNVEHGAIERPLNPVLRIGTPVYKDNIQVGILIINIYMKKFLQEFTNSPTFNIYLIDKNGYILTHSQHKDCWGHYLKNKRKIDYYFPNEAQNILSNTEYKTQRFYSKDVYCQKIEKIKMIVAPKEDLVEEKTTQYLKNMILIMIGIVFISFPLSFVISKTPAKLKEEVDELNHTLEDKINLKTLELQKLNESLEKTVEERTQEQRSLLSLFDLSDAVLFKWNNDEEWSVSYVSQSVYKLIGYEQADFQSGKVVYSKCIHPEDLPQVMHEVGDAIELQKYFFIHKPYRIITKSGDIKWILDNTVVVRDKDNNITSFLGYLTDITELKKTEIELRNISITDQLTKTYNRLYLDEILQNLYHRFCREHDSTSVILIDIDHFKAINDNYGHLVGDIVLIEFATLLKNSVRSGDIVGRWGGEEFLIVLPKTNLIQAMILAEKLRSKIADTNFSKVGEKTASFGVATLLEDMSIETLIDTADEALYLSKKNGRNKVSTIQKEVTGD